MATTPIKRPSFSGQIEVPCIEPKDSPANLTRLEPLAVSEFASTVDPLVGLVGDALQVGESVVSLFAVDVVDAVSGRDGAVCSCPPVDVLENKFPAE